ncbi:MAG: hypothetical protein SVO01_09590 [Thermotogota bacterium]|nr:hypothetical protein [Thermotogota bacterium]
MIYNLFNSLATDNNLHVGFQGVGMDISRVDKIIQYALLVAGDEDDFPDRHLGPIHLIKYVYLADLAYAKTHAGETFTGVKWQFYKFGPWAQEVNKRIEPALLHINAEKKTFPSNYGDKEEWVRWRVADDNFVDNLEIELPFIITVTLRRNVHQFGQATPELLAHVYSTEPMLSAAPKEFLDFSTLKTLPLNSLPEKSNNNLLSKKKQKNLKANLRKLRSKSAEKLAAKRKKKLVKPPISPRYDDVYYEGLEWLDSLAGEKIPTGDKDVVFSDSIWKSPARTGDDFSY